MPDKTTFVFLDPVNRPSASRSAKARKQVRSLVASQQHRNRRQQEGQRLRESLEDESAGSRSSNSSSSHRNYEEQQESYRIVSPSADLFHPSIAALRTGDLAFQLYILNDPSNIIGNILYEAKVDAFSAVSTYQTVSNLQARIWEGQFRELTTPGQSEKYLPYGMFIGPALTAAVILVGLSYIFLSQRQDNASGSLSPDHELAILRLRGHVIQSINAALDDPQRALSDEVMVAVLVLARADALHRLRDSYPLHMEGLMRIINLRGGWSKVGFGGVLEAFIRWQDASFAELVGGRTYCHLAKDWTPVRGIAHHDTMDGATEIADVLEP